jgi:hypothetical protein
MAYTMPGPQANRGTMAGRPLALTMMVKDEKKIKAKGGHHVPWFRIIMPPS